MENKRKNGRNYGIDLMRMLAMLFVTILHVLGQGGILNGAEPRSANYWIAWFMEVGAYCAVNCYALISGYVGVNSKYKYSSVILLWLRVVFYTILITGIFSVVLPEAVSLVHWKNAVFPVMTGQYWYFTAYFALFFFIPIINNGISALTQKQSTALVVSMLIVFSVLPTVFADVFATGEGYTALWLIILYIIGAYIKKYDSLKKINILAAAIGYAAMVFASWFVKYMTEKGVITFITNPDILIKYTSPTIVASAVFLLALFEKIKIPSFVTKVIAVASPAAFSVYLIHTHHLVWWHYMNVRFQAYASASAVHMVLCVLGTALGIYLVCTVIDLVREAVFKLFRIKKIVEKLECRFIAK